MEVISSSVSQIARTGNGLSFAFVRLDAHGKGLQSADMLSEYIHLRYIDLSDNAIASLTPGLVKQEYLLALNVSKNKLSVISNDVFVNKLYLQHLLAADNKIGTCGVTAWPMLAKMDLNRNQLTELNIVDAPALIHLEARENSINSIISLQTPKLKDLYLAGNQLLSLSHMDQLQALERLHLRGNPLKSLSGFSEMNENLTYLNLRGNKIASFTEVEKLATLKRLNRLNLSENPISEQENYRANVVYRLAQIKIFDKEPVTQDEREEAEQVRLDNEQTAIAAKLAEEEALAAKKAEEEEALAARKAEEEEEALAAAAAQAGKTTGDGKEEPEGGTMEEEAEEDPAGEE